MKVWIVYPAFTSGDESVINWPDMLARVWAGWLGCDCCQSKGNFSLPQHPDWHGSSIELPIR